MNTYILIIILKMGGGFSAEFATQSMCNLVRSDVQRTGDVVLARCFPKGD